MVLLKVVFKGTLKEWCEIVFADSAANPTYSSGNLYIEGEDIGDVLVIPDDVEYFCPINFSYLGIKDIYLPASIKQIEASWWGNGYEGLENIYVSDDNKYFYSENGVLFGNNPKSIYKVPQNKALECFTIASDVETVKDYAFSDCKSIKKLEIPISLNYAQSAFININIDDTEDVIKEKALSNDNVKKHTDGKDIVKVIVIKNKIVNIVIKG